MDGSAVAEELKTFTGIAKNYKGKKIGNLEEVLTSSSSSS